MKYQSIIPKWSRLLSFCLLLGFLFVATSADAQSRRDLEAKRKRLLEEIAATNQRLETTQADKLSALDQYLTVQKQIKRRQQLIRTLDQEVEHIDNSIERTVSVVDALTSDLDQLRAEYAQMIRLAYRHKLNNSAFTFLFSAQDFNDAIRRWRYLKQYDAYRKKQALLITQTQATLRYKIDQLEHRRKEKQRLLASEQQQKQLLDKELNNKNKLLKQLKSSEKSLAGELGLQQKLRDKLDGAIEGIILEEARKKKRALAAAAKAKARPSAKVANNTIAATNFSKQRGILPWPVASGKVVKSFGKHQHPKYKNVVTQNNGVDIDAPSGAVVMAIFEGEVLDRRFIPGHRNMVIISHGDYYSVYANLETLSVKKGQQIKQGDRIGQLGSEQSILHFEVWKGKKRLNPETWILK